MRRIQDNCIPIDHKKEEEDVAITYALSILEKRMHSGPAMTDSRLVTDFLKLRLLPYEHEVFLVIFLNNKHIVIDVEVLFTGTIDMSAVYPREVVKAALKHNAAAVVFGHNHPAGIAEPSMADVSITQRLIRALQTVDIRVLDHIVVAGSESVSMAERGMI